MQDLMIDFETLGTNPDTTVISVGCVFFNPDTGQKGPTFYMAFEIDGQMKKGRTIDASTLKWWMGQSGGAKKVFNEQAKPAEVVLSTFAQWCKANCGKKTLMPWGNGATFDISIMENLFSQYQLDCPWMYYNVMDLRTFRRFLANNAKIEKKGTNHNALDDANSQADFVIEHYAFFKQMLAAFAEMAKTNASQFGTPE